MDASVQRTIRRVSSSQRQFIGKDLLLRGWAALTLVFQLFQPAIFGGELLRGQKQFFVENSPPGSTCLSGLSQQVEETTASTWKIEGSPKNLRVQGSQLVLPDTRRPGDPSAPWQKFVLAAQNNSQVVFVHALPKARVLDELVVEVPVRCNQPGAILRLRVTLPRSQDRNTGRPIQFFLLGPSYMRAGRWDRLAISGIPRQISRQMFVLRAEHGPQVDHREAYVDEVGVIVYVGKETTEIELGTPVIQGFVPAGDSLLAPRSESTPGQPPATVAYPQGASAGQSAERFQPENPTHLKTQELPGRAPVEGNPELIAADSAFSSSPADLSSPRGLASSSGRISSGTPDWVNARAVPGDPKGVSREDFPSGGSPSGNSADQPSSAILTGAEWPQSRKHSAEIEPTQFLAPIGQNGSGELPSNPQPELPEGLNLRLQGDIPSQNLGATPPQLLQGSSPGSIPNQASNNFSESPAPHRTDPPGAPVAAESAPKLVGSAFMDGFRPFYPRLITWKGEPLLFVRQLGVNGIWVAGEAPLEMLAEARRVGLWVVASPPQSPPNSPPTPSGESLSLSDGSSEGWSRLLAWNLGHQRGRADLSILQQLTERVRTSSPRTDAPTVCHVLEGTREISRVCDLLVFERPLWEESLPPTLWWEWLCRRAELARPGTPFWCGIPAELPPWVNEQLRLAGLPDPPAPSWQALRVATFLAIGAGARGVVFTTAQRLDGSDSLSQWRHTNLQLLQTELEMIEPFLSGGTVSGQISSSDGSYVGILLRTDRARLVIPVDLRGTSERRRQPTSPASIITFTVPGIPEAYRAYLLMPGSLRPLRHRRTAGGMLVQLEHCPLGGHLLLTNEPVVVTGMNQRAAQAGPTATSLLRRLVRQELELLPQSGFNSTKLASFTPAFASNMGEVSRLLGESDDQFRLGNYAASWQAAARALEQLHEQNRLPSANSCSGDTSCTVSHPFRWATGLPWTSEPTPSMAKVSPGGSNFLPEGDMEDLSLLLQAGWRHYQNPAEPAVAEVFQGPEAAFRGRGGLVLRVAPAPDQPAATFLETPPVWLLSPTLPAPAAEWIRISLWVKIPEEIQATVEGLVVADSYGGLPMALRLRKTEGWKRLELYRRVPPGRPLEVLVALTGYGTAYIDELTIEPLSFVR